MWQTWMTECSSFCLFKTLLHTQCRKTGRGTLSSISYIGDFGCVPSHYVQEEPVHDGRYVSDHLRMWFVCLRLCHFLFWQPTHSEQRCLSLLFLSYLGSSLGCVTLIKVMQHFGKDLSDLFVPLFQLGFWTPTNVFRFGCNWPAQFHNKLLGIQANLDDVIQKSEERSQRERGHEESHHPKLDDWGHRWEKISTAVTGWALWLLLQKGKLTVDTTGQTQFSSKMFSECPPSLGEMTLWWSYDWFVT